MITVYYMYHPKHAKENECIEYHRDFGTRRNACVFIKYVVGNKFDGYVTSWVCDDSSDNEWLNKHCNLSDSYTKFKERMEKL